MARVGVVKRRQVLSRFARAFRLRAWCTPGLGNDWGNDKWKTAAGSHIVGCYIAVVKLYSTDARMQYWMGRVECGHWCGGVVCTVLHLVSAELPHTPVTCRRGDLFPRRNILVHRCRLIAGDTRAVCKDITPCKHCTLGFLFLSCAVSVL